MYVSLIQKESSNSELEDEYNSDLYIIDSDKDRHDSDDENSDILYDSDKQVILSIILISDSSSCIYLLLFKKPKYMAKFCYNRINDKYSFPHNK